MAKEPPKIGISGYYVPDFANKIDPSRLIIEQIINTSSGRTSNVGGGLKLLESNKGYGVSDSVLSLGKIEQIGRSIRVPEELYIKVGDKLVDPYPKGVMLNLAEGYDTEGKYSVRKDKLSSTTFMELLEQMGLVENRPVSAPRQSKRHRQNKGIVSGILDVNDHFSFTPKFYDAIERIKTADSDGKPLSIMQVLDDVGALPKPTPLIEGTVDEDKSKRRPVGRASAAAQETQRAALERQKAEAAAKALDEIKGSEFDRTVRPALQEKGFLPVSELPEPELEAEKPPMTVQEIMDERDRIATETIDANKKQGLKATGERIANMPFKVAEEKPGYIKAFIDTFRNRGAKSILLGAIGGGAGLVLDAALNAADASPTGFSWDSMPTPQIEGLVKSYEGGGPTAEERLSIAEYPPKSPEELRKIVAERKEPMIQGAKMYEEDLQRTENIMGLNLKKQPEQPTLQEQMKNLMPQQQTQGTAQ